MLRNPYIHTNTVLDPTMFFGRRALLRYIYGGLLSKQCISLIGLHHVGKSSLLHALLRHELQDDFADSLQKHIFVLLDLREYNQKSRARKHLELKHEPEAGSDAFKALLSEIQEQGFHTVLLMDAFDNVARNSHFNWQFFSFLRSQANFGKVSYVTSTTAPLQDVCHGQIKDSPFFNIFDVQDVGALDLPVGGDAVDRELFRVGILKTVFQCLGPHEVSGLIELGGGRHAVQGGQKS